MVAALGDVERFALLEATAVRWEFEYLECLDVVLCMENMVLSDCCQNCCSQQAHIVLLKAVNLVFGRCHHSLPHQFEIVPPLVPTVPYQPSSWLPAFQPLDFALHSA